MAEIKVTLVNGELAGKTAQEISKAVRQATVELSKAKIGTEEWVKANKKLEEAKDLQEDLGKQIKSTATASDMLRNAWNNLPGAQFFNQIGDSFRMMKSGVGGLVSQFGVLKVAIASAGIGLLIIAFATLYNWFKNVNTGADFLEDAFASIKAVIDVLIDRLGKFGSGLVKFLSGDFKAGIDEMGQSFKGVGDEIARDVREARNLAAAMRDLEDAEIDYRVKAAATENQIKRLMLQAKNRSLSEKERIALLDMAMALEKNQNQELLKNSEEALRIANQQAAQRLNISKETSESEIAFGKRILEEFKKDGQVQADDLRDKVIDMLLSMEDAEGKSIALQEKIQNQRDALAEKADAATQKRREAEAKAREKEAQDEITAWNNLQQLKIEAMADNISKEIEQIQFDTQRKIEALIGSEELIEEQRALLKQAERERMREATLEWEDQILADVIAFDAELQAQEMAVAERSIEIAQREADQKRAIEEAKLEFAVGALDILIGLLGVDEAARKKNAAAIKAFTIAQIIVDLQREVSGYMAHPGSIASLGVVGTIKAVLATVRAGVAIGKVASSKFQDGGIVNGPRHSQGGIPGIIRTTRQPIEFEGGEYIIRRQAVNRLGVDTLNKINSGLLFEAGGVVPKDPLKSFYLPDTKMIWGGGAAPWDVNKNFDLIEKAIVALDSRTQQLVESTNSRIDRIQVINDPLDTQSVIDRIKRIENEVNV